MTTDQEERLRTHPRERFTGDTKVFDTEQIFADLAGESRGDIDGHRQITLFKSGTSTVVAFLFEEGGALPEHQADGVASIQVLQGEVVVETPDERHSVGEDGLLLLRPGVSHSVEATEPSKMLLMVHLRKPESEVESTQAGD